MHGRVFNVGDLVLHRIQSNKDMHKFSSPWDAPYIIHEVLRPGAYRLKDPKNDTIIPNAWNIKLLCPFTFKLCTLTLYIVE